MQWMALQAPDVVVAPWGSPAITTEFWDDCLNLRAIGIAPVFPVGSSGPGSGTTTTPGNFPLVFGVGTTDNNDNIASFSSRGPAPNQYPWNDTIFWSRPDWNLTKPDISAPGVNIRTSDLGGGYTIISGSSFACAHVAGALALLLSKDSTADYLTLYNLLLDYADEPAQGAPYPNNNYGWGRLNVYSALQQLGSEEYGHGKPEIGIKVLPNPFTRQTGIKAIMPVETARDAKIAIYDHQGSLIRILSHSIDKDYSPQYAIWDGKDKTGDYVPAGIYFFVIKNREYTYTEKVIFLD